MIASLLGTLMVMIGGIGGPDIVYAAPEEPQPILVQAVIEWTPERIVEEIEARAGEYGVSARVMKEVIACESTGSTTIQSKHPRRDKSPVSHGDPTKEQSFGLSQINLPAHPDVTYEQSIDAAFSIDFMASEFSKGNAWKWTCWKNMQ